MIAQTTCRYASVHNKTTLTLQSPFAILLFMFLLSFLYWVLSLVLLPFSFFSLQLYFILCLLILNTAPTTFSVLTLFCPSPCFTPTRLSFPLAWIFPNQFPPHSVFFLVLRQNSRAKCNSIELHPQVEFMTCTGLQIKSHTFSKGIS